MDFKTFMQRIDGSQCPKWTSRQKRLEAFNRALQGKMYDHLRYGFSQERRGADGWTGDRVLLDDRRAAVQDRLPAELTRDLAGMIFGESHRPTVIVKDDKTTSDWVQAFVKDTGLWLTMLRVVWAGAIGSACVVLRVLGEGETDADGGFVPNGKGAYHFEVWPTYQCRPVFRRTAPSELQSVERVWFVGEDALHADGYDVAALKAEWERKKLNRRQPGANTAASLLRNARSDWAMRLTLDENAETWCKPVPRWIYERADWKESDWESDTERSIEHALGEVPARWIRPLPLDDDDLFPDGLCLFEPVIDFQFRIDRTLSQVGRAFDYAGDPQMVQILGGGGGGGFGDLDEDLAVGGTASDVMTVSKDGDVKFIEARGDALAVAIETYVKTLRDAAREAGAMSRITPDGNARTELSAVAMKMLNYAQTVVADILRITVGEQGMIPLIRLGMRLWSKVEVALPSFSDEQGNPRSDDPDAAARIDASWPDYYELHGQDKLFEVQATVGAREGGLISSETAVGNTAGLFDVQDSADELNAIESDRNAQEQRDLQMANAQAAITAKHTPQPPRE